MSITLNQTRQDFKEGPFKPTVEWHKRPAERQIETRTKQVWKHPREMRVRLLV